MMLRIRFELTVGDEFAPLDSVEMRQRVEADYQHCGVVKDILANAAVPDLHVQRNGRRRRLQNLLGKHGYRTSGTHDQNPLAACSLNGETRTLNTRLELLPRFRNRPRQAIFGPEV